MIWGRNPEDYERYLEELEQERWDEDSLARMRDSAFAVSLELRRFLEFSDLIIRKELAGATQINPCPIWDQLKIFPKPRRRLTETPLSRWLGRTNKFSIHLNHVKKFSSGKIPLKRRVLATQALLKSWINEIASISLANHTTWQSVTFFYSIESALATVVYLLSNTKITSHSDVLNSFRSLILCPLRQTLFPPLDFAYRRIKEQWTCDWNLPTNSVIKMCPLIVRTAIESRHGDWITYFHLLHSISELYRYKTALPFLMTGSKRLRIHNNFFWD